MEKKKTSSCCAPDRGAGPLSVPAIPEKTGPSLAENAVPIPGGRSIQGTRNPVIPMDGEDPLRPVRIAPFKMSPTAVTNAEFAAFITDTGYETEAERFGWSFVFWSDVSKDVPTSQAVMGLEWWRNIPGAKWNAVNGPGSETELDPDHPVVHVSWNDAKAFAKWAGGRLPTEAEWEHAARGGLGDVRYPWGDRDPDDADFLPCNIWQGQFPETNLVRDGYKTTAPAKSFEPNGYGLFNMVGNVWEWVNAPYTIASQKRAVKERLRAMRGYKVSKGGSFLCHRSYCHRYRIAARIGNSPDSTTTHQGMRLVFDI